MCYVLLLLLIIITERRDFGGIMSNDCKDTLHLLHRNRKWKRPGTETRVLSRSNGKRVWQNQPALCPVLSAYSYLPVCTCGPDFTQLSNHAAK